MAFLLSNIAAKAAEERKKKQAQPTDGSFFLANAASEAATARQASRAETAAQQTPTTKQQTTIGKSGSILGVPFNAPKDTIPGTSVPVNSKRGEALASIIDDAQKTRAYYDEVRLNPSKYAKAENADEIRRQAKEAQAYLKNAGQYIDTVSGMKTDTQLEDYLRAIEKAQSWYDLDKNEDYEQQSQYAQKYVPGTEERQTILGKVGAYDYYTKTGSEDIIYDYVNRRYMSAEDAARVEEIVALNDMAYGQTHGGWNELPEDVVKTFDYLYATRGQDEAYDYLNSTQSQGMTAEGALAWGLVQGIGAPSIAAAIGSAYGEISGDEDFKLHNRDTFNELAQLYGEAKEEYPGITGAGQTAGNLMLMSLIGQGVGAIGTAAAGAGETAATASKAALTATNIARTTASNALTWVISDAVHNAGALTTGNMSGESFARSLGVSAAAGAAGSLTQGLVETGLASVLMKNGLMTPFAEFVRQTTAGTASAGAYVGTSYALSEEKPSDDELATQLVTAFAFALIGGISRSIATTEADAAAFEQATDAIAERYRRLSENLNSLPPEERARAAQEIITETQALRQSLNSRYIAGQQQNVNNMNAALNIIEQVMNGYIEGYAYAQNAATPQTALPGSTSMAMTTRPAPAGADPAEALAVQDSITQTLQTAMEGGLVEGAEAQQANNLISEAVNNVPYEVRRDAEGNVYIDISEDILAGKPENEWRGLVRQTIQKIFANGLNLKRGTIYSNRTGRGEFSNGSYTRMLERTDPEMYADKLRMAAGSDGIVANAENYTYENAGHDRTDDIVGFNRGNITVSVKGRGYTGDVLNAIYSDGKETFFDIGNLARKNITETSSPERYAENGFSLASEDASVTPTITQPGTFVNPSAPSVTPELQREAMAAMQKAVNNSFGKAGAEAAMSAYDPQSAVNTMDYLREFTSIYNAARNGTALPDHTNVLTKAQQEAAYTSGIADRTSLQTPAEKSTIEVTPAKRAQFEALQAADVQSDDFEAITAPEQIMTFAEAVQAAQGQKGQVDFDLEDAQAALDKGEITVYSAGPIRTGSFVTPSRIVAQSMTNGRISSTTVPLDSVAWTDYAGGQFVGELEGIDYGREGRSDILRQGSERNAGTSSGEQAGGMVGRAEEAQGANGGRQEARARSEEGRAPARADERREVSTEKSSADIGLPRGSKTDAGLRTVSYEEASESGRKVIDRAKKQGLEVTLVRGGYFHVEGVEEDLRGCIKGNRAWVRDDDPDFSSEQIYDHEYAHKLIDTGKLDPKTVKLAIGENLAEAVAQLYADLYSNMSAEDAWLEMICDSRADMNVFEKMGGAVSETYQQVMQKVKAAAQVNEELAPTGVAYDADTESANPLHLIKNVMDPAMNDYSPNRAADDYIFFDPASVKSADLVTYDDNERVIPPSERFSENADLRFSSLLDPEALEAENEHLRKDYETVTAALAKAQSKAAYWEGQTKPSAAPSPDATDINRFARYLVSTNATNLKAKDIAPALTEMAEYIMRGGNAQDELTFTGVKERAVDIAHDILQNYSELQDSTALSDYKEIRKHIRDWGTIRVPGNDLPPDFKDWKAAHRWLRVAVSTGTDIDMVYKDLSTSWPWIFPPDANYGSDQLYAIAEGVRAAEPAYWNPNDEMMAEATEYLANQIIDGLVNGYVDELGKTVEMPIRQAHTYADRMQKKLADQKYDAAQKLEEQKAFMQAAVRQARERSDQRLANLKAHYAEVQQDARQRKTESNMRTRLLKIAKRLADKKLPTPSRALVNEYIGQLDLVAKSMTGKTKNTLQALSEMYNDALENDPYFVKDDAIEKKLARLYSWKISDLTIEQVQDLTDILLGMEHQFNNEKRELESADRRDVYQKGVQIISDVKSGHEVKPQLMEKLDDFFVRNTLSPLRELHRQTGYNDDDPLYAAGKRLNDGQLRMNTYVMQSSKAFDEWVQSAEFMDELTGKKAKTIKVRGLGMDGNPVEVEITPDMRISLYLHNKNLQNQRHIGSISGGIKVPDMKLYRAGKIAEAYAKGTRIRLQPSEVGAICANMSARERALAERIYKYFNTTSREALSDVHERLKGYPMRFVEDYFPIDTDGNFTKAAAENIAFDGSLEGSGWLKERVVNAKNPIMLYDATSVLLKAIQAHGQFVGLAIPIRDFNKLYAMSGPVYNETGDRVGSQSVKETIKQTWGTGAANYIDQLLGDLQNTHSDSNSWTELFRKIRSNYAGATLALNLSVAMKQAGSYPTAAAVLGWKPLAAALKDFGKVDLDYIASMTPLQWLRSQGYSTPELGDLKAKGKQLPKALNWIQGMDLLTTRKLWKACEYYMEYNHADMKKGSAEYKATISEIYNRVIEETQPNYTVMQRPQLLRSNNELLRDVSMFKTQLFQNFNILYDAIGNMVAKRTQYQANPDPQTKSKYEAAKKDAGRAISSQIVQSVVIAAMTLAWNALRGKLKRYKDEEKDRITGASFAKRFGLDVASGFFSMVPFGSEVFSALSSKLTGEKWYGLEGVSTGALTDFISTLMTAVDQIGKSLEAAQSGQTAAIHKQVLAWENIAETGAKMFGVPASNVMNLIKAVYGNITKTACGKYYGEYLAMLATTPIEGNKGQYYDLLYKAQQENPEAFWEIYNSLIEIDAMASDKKSTAENIDAALKQRAKKAG